MIRRCARQHLASEQLDAAAYEHVIDLTVRATRRICSAPNGTSPTTQHRVGRRSPEVEVAGKDLRSTLDHAAAKAQQVSQRPEPPQLRRNVQPDHLDGRAVDRDGERERVTEARGVLRNGTHRNQLAVEDGEARAHRELPRAFARHPGSIMAALASMNLHAHERDGLDVVAVVAQPVEQADTAVVAPGFGDDDEVGAEAANHARHVETNTVEPAEPTDPPVCVERRDREVALRYRCAGQAARGGMSGHPDRSRSSLRV